MSQENVEIVRRLFELAKEGLGRGDPGAAFDGFVREGVVASNLQGRAMVAGVDDLVGRAGYVELMRLWTEDFDDFWMEPEEIIDIDDDRVVATVRHYGTGKGSGVRVEMRMAAVYTFGAGRIVRVDMFPDRNHALRAVGLREYAMSREENVEVVRRAFESFNRRDLAGAVAELERDAEWVPYLAALEEEIYRGRDDIERMWREVLRDVPDLRMEFVRVVADSPETVVLEVEFRGMGKASGADIRTTIFQAVSFRDGKVTRVQGFRAAADALEAVGLRE